MAGLADRGKLEAGAEADFVVLSPSGEVQNTIIGGEISEAVSESLRRQMADKGGFPHHMLKEIFEQPQGLRDTIAPRVSVEEGLVRLDDVRITADELRSLQRINIVASGTSRHAGMAGST